MDKRTIRTTELPPSLHRNFARTSLLNLKGIPGYSRAKNDGDPVSAYEVVKKVMCNETGRVKMLELFSWLEKDVPVCIVPVIGAERKWSINALPLAYAKVLAGYYSELTGASARVLDSIVKVSRPNTGLGHSFRLGNRVTYDGKIPDGNFQYILADDTYTFGRTVMSLMEHIVSQGGNVVLISTLASRYTHQIKPSDELIDKFRKEYRITNDNIREITGNEIEYFTAGEICGLNLNPNRKLGPEGLRRICTKENIQGYLYEA